MGENGKGKEKMEKRKEKMGKKRKWEKGENGKKEKMRERKDWVVLRRRNREREGEVEGNKKQGRRRKKQGKEKNWESRKKGGGKGRKMGKQKEKMGIGDYVLKQRKNERVDRKKEFKENRCGKETEKASIITGLNHKKKKKTTVKR